MRLEVAVDGIGVWSPRFEGWPAFRQRGDPSVPAAASRRPVPLLLPPAERRRVPDGVAVALEVAREALANAASTGPFDPASLASVFASAHGELAIVDYLCSTLATDPLSLSPTRFHHSVHNAAAGYWSIATPSVGPSTSLAAGDDSFALGLVEAATQVVAEHWPVLLVVFDTPAVGLLGDAIPNTALFGAALLLSPPRADGPTLRLSIGFGAAERPASMPAHAVTSPAARSLVLLDAIAGDADTTVDYPLAGASAMSVNVRHVRGSDADPHGDRT